ncbi:MAG TPA: hypothetical protein VK738_16145 [Terriglobales bacterium]|nr:hypothetical protein [Terriglobales bacterium]
MGEVSLQGKALILYLFDVCEEINLDQLRSILGTKCVGQGLQKHAAYENAQFIRPPVVEALDPFVIDGSQPIQGTIKYYDYGVVSLIFEIPFQGDWRALIDLSSRWMSESRLEQQASAIAQEKLKVVAAALIKPYKNWLNEDYFIFAVKEVPGSSTAAELVRAHAAEIAQIVRGETSPLSEGEQAEVIQSSISYYPSDLAVIGWNAAFIYDTETGAQTAIQLLEYANSQLLEFRHYDDLLTRELAGVYKSLDRKGSVFDRWRMGRSASRLQTVLLDVTELTERVDNAVKFLSDMFSARLYRLAAAKVGVPDYKNLVQEKLKTAEELYGFMVDDFHQSRAFVLEVMVVIILVIELVYVFHGKG